MDSIKRFYWTQRRLICKLLAAERLCITLKESIVKRSNEANGFFVSKTTILQLDMERYFGLIDQGAMLLEEAIKKYLSGNMESFEQKTSEINTIEHEADELRRKIKHRLYSEMLIPDSRGDVLGLLETLDNVLDSSKHVSTNFSIEHPEILSFLKEDFLELTEACVKTVLELTLAVRAFFRELYRVSEHLDKVHFWEREADLIEERIKRKAFSSEEIQLFSKRVHIRYFAERISMVADEAEAVAERLAVYAIKRAI